MNRSEYVQIIRSSLVSMIKERVMKGLISQLPFFASGPLGFIASALLGKLINFLIDGAEVIAFISFIEVRTSLQGKAFLESAKNFHNEQDKEKKKLLEKELIDKARELIKLAN